MVLKISVSLYIIALWFGGVCKNIDGDDLVAVW